MNIGNQIANIRKEKQLTQEEFGNLFYVTRQTVSNWENGKSYPDLQTLIDISNQFGVSLDVLVNYSPLIEVGASCFIDRCLIKSYIVSTSL